MFWQNNRQALLQAHSGHQELVERLDHIAPTSEVELIATQDEDYTLLFRGIPLHASTGAMQEARQIVSRQCRPALGRAHLVLGMGLGYLLQAVYQHSPGQIVIYEPDVSLLKFVLENVDLTEFIESRRVFLATTPAELLNWLNPLVAWEDPLDILITQGYATLMANEIPGLMAQLFALVDERVRDYKTGQYFHWQWIRQFFQNLPYIGQANSFSQFNGAFQDKPALIIGRGPSLDAGLEAIRALGDSMILIAVGGALRTLWQAGITPDFAVFYDASGMQEQLQGLPESYLSPIHFLLSPFTEPCCFTAPAESKVVYFPQSGEAFAQWLYASSGAAVSPSMLEGGGTVSLVALQAALAMQCNPVVLIGQDLAFPNDQVYAGGTPLQMDSEGRLALPKSETLYAAAEAMGTVEGQDGQPLPALKAYAGFIRHFERIAQANPTIQLINASIGGAKIQGYALQPLTSMLNAFQPWKPAVTEVCNALGLGDAVQAQSAIELRPALAQLKQAVQLAIDLHEQALANPADESRLNRLIYELLQEHYFISHCLMFEMMSAQRNYNPNATTPQEIEANQALLSRNTQQCRDLLRNQLLPLILDAECRLMVAENSSTACQSIHP
ncbi:MAG: hypothetical protein K0Q50_351 [Vampirovibrio sp.]|jgi:hypothetical protein|nr:hypothetical protein [Vampirovibrio sp.]